MNYSQATLGIDLGRVIMSPVLGGRQDTSFLRGTWDQAMATPPTPDAFETIRILCETFQGRLWIVSKAGPNTQRKSLAWLDHQGFYDETGFDPDQVKFCRRREEKAGICRPLGVTHFIDDRLDVLSHLRGLVPHLYLFGEQKKRQHAPRWVVPTLTWPIVLDSVLATLPENLTA